MFESSIGITNSFEETVVFHLEPWGEEIEMPTGATFVVVAKAEQVGAFQVDHSESGMTVWAWPSATVKIFHDGEEVGIGFGGERPAVPPVPEGRSVSSFLRLMLRKDSDV